MTSFDRCRRAASIVLVMACFVLAPGVALAQFTSTKGPDARCPAGGGCGRWR